MGEGVQMIVLKDDSVRLTSDETGMVIELWGRARPFMSFKRDSDGTSVPLPASDVKEILQRAPVKKNGRRWG